MKSRKFHLVGNFLNLFLGSLYNTAGFIMTDNISWAWYYGSSLVLGAVLAGILWNKKPKDTLLYIWQPLPGFVGNRLAIFIDYLCTNLDDIQ